jgi:hypothetical protein
MLTLFGWNIGRQESPAPELEPLRPRWRPTHEELPPDHPSHEPDHPADGADYEHGWDGSDNDGDQL